MIFDRWLTGPRSLPMPLHLAWDLHYNSYCSSMYLKGSSIRSSGTEVEVLVGGTLHTA